MDANGNYPAGIGTPTEIIAEKVCAENGYFQALSVGECDVPEYTFPLVQPTENQIIATRAVFILNTNNARTFSLGYQYTPLSVFNPNLLYIAPAGVYELYQLLEDCRIYIQSFLGADVPGAVLEYNIVAGKIQWSVTVPGPDPVILYSAGSPPPPNETMNYKLGQSTAGQFGVVVVTYSSEPRYDNNNYMKFLDYQFDNGGTVYEGANLTLRGNLIVNGQIVENLRVEDGIIEAAYNQVGDTITSGFGMLNNNNNNISGLFRDKDSKQFSLLNNALSSSVGEGLNVPGGNGTLDLSTLKASVIQGKANLLDLELNSASRINVNATDSYLRSPNETTQVRTNNTEAYLELSGVPRIQADTSESFITPPNDLGYFYIDDTSSAIVVDDGADFSEFSLNPLECVWSSNSAIRLRMNPTLSELKSPNGLHFYNVNNNSIDLTYGGLQRHFINATQNLSIAPGNLTQSIIRDTEIELLCDFAGDSSSFFVRPTTGAWNIDSVNRLDFTSIQTAIKAPNQDGLYVTNNNVNLRQGAVQRVQVDGAATLIRSPDQLSIVNAENGRAELTYQTNWLVVQPTEINATFLSNKRLLIDGTLSSIKSPDLTGAIATQNNQVTISAGTNYAQVNAAEFLYVEGAVIRAQINAVESTITAPNNTEELTVKNQGLFYKRTGIDQQSVPLGYYAQIADLTHTNNTGELSLVGSIIGTDTVPANVLKVGDSYHWKISGIFTGQTADTLTFRMKLGTATIADSGALTIGNNLSNIPFEIEGDLTIRAIGGVGVAAASGDARFTYNTGSPTFTVKAFSWNDTNTTTVNSTVSNVFNFTVQQSNVAQSITVRIHIMKQIF